MLFIAQVVCKVTILKKVARRLNRQSRSIHPFLSSYCEIFYKKTSALVCRENSVNVNVKSGVYVVMNSLSKTVVSSALS